MKKATPQKMRVDKIKGELSGQRGRRQLKDVLSKNVGKGRNRRVVPKSGAKIMPKGNAEFTTSLLETKKGITSTASQVRASAATNFATGHILTNIGFSSIIV